MQQQAILKLRPIILLLLLLLLSITFLSFCNGRFPTIVIPPLNSNNNNSTDSYKNNNNFNNNNYHPRHHRDFINVDSNRNQHEEQQKRNDVSNDDNNQKTYRQSKIKKKRNSCPEYCLQQQQQQQQQQDDTTTDRTTTTTTTTTTRTIKEEVITPKAIRIFYFILIHNNQTAYDAIHLYRSIRHPNNIILFHIDTKVSSTLYNSFLLNDKCSHLHNSTTRTGSSGNRKIENTSSEYHHPLWDEVCSCTCGMKIQVESIYSMEWSKWSMTVPTLWAITVACSIQYKNQWTTFINLSGDTIPVFTPTIIQTKLLSLYPYNFVTSSSCITGLVPTNVYTFPKWWHKRRHYTKDDTVLDPTFVYTSYNTILQRNITNNITISTYFGSQWVILQYIFCDWLNNQLTTNNSWPNQYKDYLISSNRLMSDETYIPTILMHAKEFQHTIPKVALRDNDDENDDDVDDTIDDNNNKDDDFVLVYYNGTKSNTIRHVRYERMDENVPTAFGKFFKQQRYDVSSIYKSNSTVSNNNNNRVEISIPRPWGPYYLGVYDLYNIKRSGALFIRKVSYYIDPNIQQLLPVSDENDIPNINWPTTTNTEIVLTKKPNWDKWINALNDFNQKKDSNTKIETKANTAVNKTTLDEKVENNDTNTPIIKKVNSNDTSDTLLVDKDEDNRTPTTTTTTTTATDGDDDNDTYNSNNNDDFINSDTADTTTVTTSTTTRRRIEKQMKKRVYVPVQVPTRHNIHDTTNDMEKKNDNEEDEEEL